VEEWNVERRGLFIVELGRISRSLEAEGRALLPLIKTNTEVQIMMIGWQTPTEVSPVPAFFRHKRQADCAGRSLSSGQGRQAKAVETRLLGKRRQNKNVKIGC